MNRKQHKNWPKNRFSLTFFNAAGCLAVSLAMLLLVQVSPQASAQNKGKPQRLSPELLRERLDAAKVDAAGPAKTDTASAAGAGQAGLGDSIFGPISLLNPGALAPLFVTPAAEVDRPATGPVLKGAAEQVFGAGDLRTAMNLMFGHMAAEYADAKPMIESVKYSKLLRRPVWSICFAASMSVRDSGADGAEPSPIPGDSTGIARRSNVRPATRSNNRRNDIAEELRARLGASRGGRAERSKPKPTENPPSPAESSEDQPADPAAEQANETSATAETLDSESTAELSRNLGLVADVFAELFLTRLNDGRFGPLLAEVSLQPGDTAAGVAGTENEAESWSSDSALPMWIPGIMYLGIGPTKEMVSKASDADVDILIHFEVIIKEDRNENVQNISRCRLINVSSGKSIGLSKPIDSVAEQKLPEASGGRVYIEKQLDNLFDILDRDVAVTSLPTLTPEVAKRRLATLMGTSPPRSLRTLAEIRLYQSRQLLNQEEVETAFDIVGGTESLTFLYGLANERTAMAHAWATKGPDDE